MRGSKTLVGVCNYTQPKCDVQCRYRDETRRRNLLVLTRARTHGAAYVVGTYRNTIVLSNPASLSLVNLGEVIEIPTLTFQNMNVPIVFENYF